MKNFFATLSSRKTKFANMSMNISGYSSSKPKNENFALQAESVLVLNKKSEICLFAKNHSLVQSQLIANIVKKINANFISKQNCFFTITIGNMRILVYQSYLNFVVIKNDDTDNKTSKLFIEFFAVALFNFIGEDCELLRTNKKHFCDKNLIVKVFEKYFANPLCKTFERIFNKFIHQTEFAFSKQKMTSKFASSEISAKCKLIDVILIDYANCEVIFSLRKAQGKYHDVNYLRNSQIKTEVLYNADKIVKAYMNAEIANDISEFKSKHITIEFTSCYPRLCFTIKFFPIYNGIIYLQIHSQNRISNGAKRHSGIKIDEIANEVRDFTDVNLAPKIAMLIENFAFEYLTSVNSITSIYTSHLFTEMKYYDSYVLRKILFAATANTNVDAFFSNANKLLYDHYRQLHRAASNNNCNTNTNPDMSTESVLECDTFTYLNEIFKDCINTTICDINKEIFLNNDFANDKSDLLLDELGRRISDINKGDITDNTMSVLNDLNGLIYTRKKSAAISTLNSLMKGRNSLLLMKMNSTKSVNKNFNVGYYHSDRFAMLRDLQTKTAIIDEHSRNQANGSDKRKSFQIHRNFNFFGTFQNTKNGNNNTNHNNDIESELIRRGSNNNNVLNKIYRDMRMKENENDSPVIFERYRDEN